MRLYFHFTHTYIFPHTYINNFRVEIFNLQFVLRTNNIKWQNFFNYIKIQKGYFKGTTPAR